MVAGLSDPYKVRRFEVQGTGAGESGKRSRALTSNGRRAGVDPTGQGGQWVAAQGTTAIVVDCEQGPMRMGLAGQLALHMQATHLPLADISAQALTTVARVA